MRNIKFYYWISCVVIIFICLLIYHLSENIDAGNIILSGTSIIISIIAIGLSDKRLSKFKGCLKVWSVRVDNYDINNKEKRRLTIHVHNNSNEPIFDVVIRIRFPKSSFDYCYNKNANVKSILHGNTKTIIDRNFQFLGLQKDEDNFIPIDLEYYPEKWLKGNVYISVSGLHYYPVTFKISPEKKEDILNAEIKKPITLKPVKTGRNN